MTPELPLTNLPHDPALEAQCAITCGSGSSAAGAESWTRPRPGASCEERVARLVRRWVARCVEDENGCLIWPGATGMGGYAHVMVPQSDGSRKSTGLHRVVYEHFVGPIPEGLDIDHRCRSRACVNWKHLEPVTTRVNLLRGERWPNRKENAMNLIMVKRADAPEHTPEAEGLLVDTDTPGVVRLVLDDGIELVADRAELVEALSALREVA
jgi:hypothetical protein